MPIRRLHLVISLALVTLIAALGLATNTAAAPMAAAPATPPPTTPVTAAATTPLPTTPMAPAAPAAVKVLAVSAGSAHTCALIEGGGMKCWGYNTTGQLGDGTTTTRLTPTDVPGLSGVTSIAAGYGYTCAIAGGALKCWGYNADGQLGDGTKTDRHTPTAVVGMSTGVTAVALYDNHTCAVQNGAVKCWGDNSEGQLGDGTTTNRLTPVQVSGLTSGYWAVSAGWYHSCALNSPGEVRCWGNNAEGQLGNSSSARQLTPVLVQTLTSGVTQLSGSFEHNCVVVASDAAACWGYNYWGQLGRGFYGGNDSSPAWVETLSSSAAAVTTGPDHSCGLTKAGAAKCWGRNTDGQVGDGSQDSVRVDPVQVSGLGGGVSALSAGAAHTCALVASGIQCWGDNSQGQLGDGTTVQRRTPVSVVGLEPQVVRTNDNIDFATDVPALASSGQPWLPAPLDTTSATVAADDPDTGCGSADNTVWYRLTPNFSGQVIVDTFGSNYDTVLAGFSGVRGSLNHLACNNDYNQMPQSQMTLTVQSGQTYYIEAAQAGMAGGGQLKLSVRRDVGPKPWLVLYYLAGDNADPKDNAGPAVANGFRDNLKAFLKEGAGSPAYSVAVFYDGPAANDSRYYYYDYRWFDSGKGELNSGTPGTLVDFVNWARDQAATQHQALVLVDHGSLGGFGQDKTSGSMMSLAQIDGALSQVAARNGKIEVLQTYACLLGNIDAGYQFRDRADFYVASEDTISLPPPSKPGPGYLSNITAATTAEGLARSMALDFDKIGKAAGEYTISVARLSQAVDLAGKVSALAGAVKSHLYDAGWAGPIMRDWVMFWVQRYVTSSSVPPARESADIYDFARLIKENAASPEDVKTAAQAVMNAISDDPVSANHYIIEEHHGGYLVGELFMAHSHGVSAFLNKEGTLRSFYNGSWGDFAAGTIWNVGAAAQAEVPAPQAGTFQWGPMLAEYTHVLYPDAADDPLPPPPLPPAGHAYVYLPRVSNHYLQTPVTPTPVTPTPVTPTPVTPTPVTPTPPTPSATPSPTPGGTPVSGGLNALVLAPTGAGLAVGGSGDVWSFDLATGAHYSLGAPAATALNAIALSPDGGAWAVGEGGTIVRLTNGTPALWTKSFSSAATLYSVALEGTGDGWAVGSGGLILRLSGGDWSINSNGGADLYGVASPGPAAAWAVGSWGYGIVHTLDAGAHWQVFDPVPADMNDRYAVAVSGSYIWAVGIAADGPYVLRFNGAQWLRVPVSVTGLAHSQADPMTYNLYAISTVGGDVWTAGNLGAFLRSRDDGASWTAYPSPAGVGDIRGMAFAATDNGWAVTAGGYLLHWNGNSWQGY